MLIRTVVVASEFQLKLVHGSLEDVAELLNLPELRVTYLDLRHATMIQALDWLLAPYHLTWQMKDADTIAIGHIEASASAFCVGIRCRRPCYTLQRERLAIPLRKRTSKMH